MSFDQTERWFFRAKDTPARLERLLRALAQGRSVELMTDRSDDSTVFHLRCADDVAVYELLEAMGVELTELAECAFEQESDDDVSEGADVELVLEPDFDGSFEWIVEATSDEEFHWPLTLLLARAVADRLGGKHYDELSNEELLAGQTSWAAPPPIVKRTRPN